MARIVELRVDTTLHKQLLLKEEELKKIADEVRELRDQVLQLQLDHNARRVIVGRRVFEVMTRSKWKFSEKTCALKARYKAQQKYEIDNKIAVPLPGATFITITEV